MSGTDAVHTDPIAVGTPGDGGLLLAGMPCAALHEMARALGARILADPDEAGPGDGRLRMLLLYRPPWEAFAEDCLQGFAPETPSPESWLERWHACQRRLLDCTALADGSACLLNAARLDGRGAALLELLRAEGVSLPAQAEPPHPEQCRVPPPAAALLARQFEELGPACFELYEELESCAQLLGREPEFRGADAPAVPTLVEVLELLAGALAHPALAAREAREAQELAGLHDGLAAAQDAREALEARLAAEAPILAEIRLENELLSIQLGQLRSELARLLTENDGMRAELGRSAATADRARRTLSRLIARADAPQA